MFGELSICFERTAELRIQLHAVVADDRHNDPDEKTSADWEHQLRWQELIDFELYQIVRASCAAPTFFPGRCAQCHLQADRPFWYTCVCCLSRLPTSHCMQPCWRCVNRHRWYAPLPIDRRTLAVAAAVVRESGYHTSRNGLEVQYRGKLVDGAMVANNPTLAGLSFMVDKQKVCH